MASKVTDKTLLKYAVKHGSAICDKRWSQETYERYLIVRGPIVGRFFEQDCLGRSSGPAYKAQVDTMTAQQLDDAGFTPQSEVSWKQYPMHGVKEGQ